MTTVAEQFPCRGPDDNGNSWYMGAKRTHTIRGEKISDERPGWTSNPGWADPSYGVGDGQGNAY